jgi:hypothetical protein
LNTEKENSLKIHSNITTNYRGIWVLLESPGWLGCNESDLRNFRSKVQRYCILSNFSHQK